MAGEAKGGVGRREAKGSSLKDEAIVRHERKCRAGHKGCLSGLKRATALLVLYVVNGGAAFSGCQH